MLLGTSVSSLTSWENFYVIVGSSSAALTGLMFVVVTLIAGTRDAQSDDGISAFGSPTVVHFCAALAIAAILSAPWQELWEAGVLLGISGLGGVAYLAIVVRRVRHQATYQPVMEDWLWHAHFPVTSYAALILAAVILPENPTPALFITGAVTMLLLFTSIHNSWDTVTYLVIKRSQTKNEQQH